MTETNRTRNETRRSLECETAYAKDTALILPPSAFILHLDLEPWRRLLWKRQADPGIGMKKWIAFLQGDFRGDFGQVRVVCTLGKMGQHEISSYAIEAVPDPVREVFIGEMTEA